MITLFVSLKKLEKKKKKKGSDNHKSITHHFLIPSVKKLCSCYFGSLCSSIIMTLLPLEAITLSCLLITLFDEREKRAACADAC